jgi:molecular chaperone Hsp33
LNTIWKQSEQLSSRFFLAATAEGAAGLFIQKMPSTDARDPDGWARVEALAATAKPEELLGLPAEELLTRLFHEETVRIFDEQPVTNNSPEDRVKVGNMLRSLGREDVYAVIKERGTIVIRDDLANHEYRFEKADIDELFSNVPETPTSVH